MEHQWGVDGAYRDDEHRSIAEIARAFKAEHSVIEAMILARAEAGLTQEALAERMGTTQSAVARLEGGRVSPTVDTLRNYARAVGKRLKVEMV